MAGESQTTMAGCRLGSGFLNRYAEEVALSSGRMNLEHVGETLLSIAKYERRLELLGIAFEKQEVFADRHGLDVYYRRLYLAHKATEDLFNEKVEQFQKTGKID